MRTNRLTWVIVPLMLLIFVTGCGDKIGMTAAEQASTNKNNESIFTSLNNINAKVEEARKNSEEALRLAKEELQQSAQGKSEVVLLREHAQNDMQVGLETSFLASVRRYNMVTEAVSRRLDDESLRKVFEIGAADEKSNDTGNTTNVFGPQMPGSEKVYVPGSTNQVRVTDGSNGASSPEWAKSLFNALQANDEDLAKAIIKQADELSGLKAEMQKLREPPPAASPQPST